MATRRGAKLRIALAGTVVAVGIASLAVRAVLMRPTRNDRAATSNSLRPPVPKRIISLSPSVTEIVFALGAGDRIVGVTRYCQYPPEARTRTKIGGVLDPNFEAIVALHPDLVIMRQPGPDGMRPFQRLKLPTLVVCHKTLEGVLDSILVIGRRLGLEAQAQRLVADLRLQMQELERQAAGRDRPRVLLALERTLGTGRIQDVYVAGPGGFLDRMLQLAGGQNACPPAATPYPVLSAEGIIRIDPDIILDMVPAVLQQKVSRQSLLNDWQQLSDVSAVRSGRVYILDNDYAFIPGPRFIALARRLARLIHPTEHQGRNPEQF